MDRLRDFLRSKCGVAIVDEAVLEYAAATLNDGSISDTDDLLCGLSPDLWARQHSVDRETMLRLLLEEITGTAADDSSHGPDAESAHRSSSFDSQLPPTAGDQPVQLAAVTGGERLLRRVPSIGTSHPGSRGSHRLAPLAYPTGLVMCGKEVHVSVAAFLERHPGELSDPAVAAYVHGLLDCNAALEVIQMEEVDEVLCGVSPSFALVPEPDRHKELSDLLNQLQGLSKKHKCCAAMAAAPQLPMTAPGPLELRTKVPFEEPANDTIAMGQLGYSQPAPNSAVMESLTALCPPGVGQDFLCHVLQGRCLGDLEAAARWIVECGDVVEREILWRAAEGAAAQAQVMQKEAEKAEKRRLFDKYQLQAVTGPSPSGRRKEPAVVAAWQPPQDSAKPKGVRYRNGIPVASRGEKYIIEHVGEEWDGGSRGKVTSKGKRGPGMQ